MEEEIKRKLEKIHLCMCNRWVKGYHIKCINHLAVLSE